jgi:hypothetical protein
MSERLAVQGGVGGRLTFEEVNTFSVIVLFAAICITVSFVIFTISVAIVTVSFVIFTISVAIVTVSVIIFTVLLFLLTMPAGQLTMSHHGPVHEGVGTAQIELLLQILTSLFGLCVCALCVVHELTQTHC